MKRTRRSEPVEKVRAGRTLPLTEGGTRLLWFGHACFFFCFPFCRKLFPTGMETAQVTGGFLMSTFVFT